MQKAGYIGTFEVTDDHRGSVAIVTLRGRINKCGIISPHFNVKAAKIESQSSLLLPARQFGHVVFSTDKGVLMHNDVIARGLGGKILGYFF